MENLGFECKMHSAEDVSLSCYYSEKLAFTITEPVTNPSQLTHKLSKPVAVRFYEFHADHDKKEIAIKKISKTHRICIRCGDISHTDDDMGS